MTFGQRTEENSAVQSQQASAAFANSVGFMSPAENYGVHKSKINDTVKVSDEENQDPPSPFVMEQNKTIVGSGGSKRRYEEANETD